MVIETVDEREKTSEAVFSALRDRAPSTAYANDVAQALQATGIEFEKTLWTIWRLIDENRLFLDKSGYLVLEKSERGE